MHTKPTVRNGVFLGVLLVSLITVAAFSGVGAAQNATNATSNTTSSLESMNATANGTMMANGTNASLALIPPNASAPSNHTLSVPIQSDLGNFTGITLDYSASNASLHGFDLTQVYTSTIVHPDGTNYSFGNNLTTSSVGFDGDSVNFTVDGFPMLNASDRVVMTYGPITNPPQPETYNVSIQLNPNTTTPSLERNASFTVTEENASLVETTGIGLSSTAGTTTMRANTTMGTNESNTTNETTGMSTNESTSRAPGASTETSVSQATSAGGATTQTSAGAASATGTSGNGPGFGVAVALVALVGAALLAVRRRT